MFVDEMGALKRLPRNDAATKIYRNSFLSKRPDDDPEKLPLIAGPAVVFLRRVCEAEVSSEASSRPGRPTPAAQV